MITLPAELDRLLPTEGQSVALETIRPVADELLTLGDALDADDNLILPDCVVIGPSGVGEITFNADYFYTSTASTVTYIHIKLPFTTAADARWFIKVWGTSNSCAQIVDLTFAGRVSGAALSSNVEHDPSGLLGPTTYVGSGSDIYLRFLPVNLRKTSIVVHSMKQPLGQTILPGDLTITASATATL